MMTATARGDGTVGKSLALLDDVAALGRPVRYSELLSRSGQPKATLHRLLRSLVKQGMLAYDPDDHTYRLGLRLVRLAHAAWAQSSLAPVARPWLDRLSELTGLTVHLAQLDGGHVLYVDKRSAVRPVEMFSQAGRIGPAYCTGVGKAMLAALDPAALGEALTLQAFHRFTATTLTTPEALRAELDRIRERGLAFDREEHEPGIICVAAAIRAAGGRLLGAVSATSTTERNTPDDLARFGPDLRATADAIAEEAEAWHFPVPTRPLNERNPRKCPV
jgi:DNA-binding IclR family transcriptional regulator